MDKAKTYFWVLLDLLVIGIIINLVFFVMPAVKRYGNSLAPTRTITVSAEGKTTVTPDLALSSFSVVSRGKNPQDLADMNNQKISAVVKFLKAEGLEDKDIKTTAYNLSPDYKYDPQTERNFITGYTLTQTVSVKMRNFAKVPEIIGGLTPLGVNQIGGISFTIEEPEKFLAIARSQAFEKAKTKAGEMASQNGTKLGRVLNIGEFQNVPVPYYAESARSYGLGSAAAPAPPTMSPGLKKFKTRLRLPTS